MAELLKEFRVGCSANNEFAECPAVAEFSVSRAACLEIIRLADLVAQNNLIDLRKFDYSARYLRIDPEELETGETVDETGGPQEMRTEFDALIVSSDDFMFMCYLKHQDARITTESQSIADLAQFFGIDWSPSTRAAAVQSIPEPEAPAPTA